MFSIVATYFDPSAYAVRIEFTFYCLGWALIAFRSFSDRKSGFPAHLLPFNLSWELFAIRDYSSLKTGWISFSNKFYFLLWLMLSSIHLLGVSRFSRKDFTGRLNDRWFWPMMASAIVLLLLYYGYFVQAPDGERRFYTVLGELAVPIISFNFMVMILFRSDLVGISFYGNLARIAGQYSTLINRSTDELSPTFPIVLCIVTIICDLVFLRTLSKMARREGFSIVHRI
jgi:hypothetical protein